MTVSLIGLIAIQVNLIGKAFRVSEENFTSQVNDALTTVAQKLEEAEMNETILSVSRELNIDLKNDIYLENEQNYRRINKLRFRMQEEIPESGVPKRSIELTDSLKEYFRIEGRDTIISSKVDKTVMWVQNEESEEGDMEVYANPKTLKMLQQTIMSFSAQKDDLEVELDSIRVDTLLQAALWAENIFMPYEFGVYSNKSEGSGGIVKSLKTLPTKLLNSQHKVELFPDRGKTNNYLCVFFPSETSYTLQSVWSLILAGILFTGVMMVGFGLTINTIFRQRKFSDMKNDFINNMTHELKTPLATISLAADSLKNPGIRNDENKSNRYLGIIKEENQRMHRQVERVLQAARFDKKEMKLKKVEIDMHNLITKAAEHTQLAIAERGGQLSLELKAPGAKLQGDRVHLSNVIYNLLDNANKYSPDNPNISVKTEVEGEYWVMEVQDKGLGIAKTDQVRIFDRFYRVSTGDLHEVKGFGLGLSYVKEIVEAHGGRVGLESKVGEGSIFSISLPMNQAA